SSVESVSITPLDGISGTQEFSTGATAKWPGSTAGDIVPQVAALVKIGTGLRGRDNRGRVYLPFQAETSISNGSLTGGNPASMTAAWLDFLADVAADATTPMLWGVAAYDRKHAGAAAHFTAASSASVES